MWKCFSFTATKDSCYRLSFSAAGLKSTTTHLSDGSVIHCWAPKTPRPNRPTLLLIHGFGANAMWQWNGVVSSFAPTFNLYIPDLLFFGGSHTARPERTESFQARCLMSAMIAMGVRAGLRVVGLSYGGFVAYSMAEQFPAAVERVVVGGAGVCMEERDVEEGLFRKRSLEEAIEVLLARTPEKLRELMRLSFYKPAKNIPSCILEDFISVMCLKNYEERKELIYALHKGRRLSHLPKITQPTLIIWGEHDQIFPLQLAHRFVRHLENNALLVVIKKAGHAINMEKTKELCKYLKAFLGLRGPAVHFCTAQ